MPARFALDEAELERAHKDVQSKVHPDRFASGSAAERRVAMQWAARANEAYRTLKSPLSRAAFLCERAGVPIDANVNTSMPVEFLAQQMEWREVLDDARADGDASRFSALVGKCTSRIASRIGIRCYAASHSSGNASSRMSPAWARDACTASLTSDCRTPSASG